MHLSREQQQLVEDNLALVRKVISDKVHGAGSIGIFTYEDLYQIGCIGLCKAAYNDKYQYAYNQENAYSEEKPCFSTYAYRLIWNEICTMLAYATKVRAESVIDPDDVITSVEMTGIDEDIADADFRAALECVLDSASKSVTGVTAKGIQALKYMAQGYTSTEIANMMGGASCHHVTAWISKARKYLQSYPKLVKLIESA